MVSVVPQGMGNGVAQCGERVTWGSSSPGLD